MKFHKMEIQTKMGAYQEQADVLQQRQELSFHLDSGRDQRDHGHGLYRFHELREREQEQER